MIAGGEKEISGGLMTGVKGISSMLKTVVGMMGSMRTPGTSALITGTLGMEGVVGSSSMEKSGMGSWDGSS